MCWAIPARIREVNGTVGTVEISGVAREVGLQLIEAAQVGDYVLVHAGFAIQKVDEVEAEETLKLFDELFAQELPGDEVR